MRLGRKRAIFALAHKLLKTAFVLIDRGDHYRNASIDLLAPARPGFRGRQCADLFRGLVLAETGRRRSDWGLERRRGVRRWVRTAWVTSIQVRACDSPVDARV